MFQCEGVECEATGHQLDTCVTLQPCGQLWLEVTVGGGHSM